MLQIIQPPGRTGDPSGQAGQVWFWGTGFLIRRTGGMADQPPGTDGEARASTYGGTAEAKAISTATREESKPEASSESPTFNRSPRPTTALAAIAPPQSIPTTALAAIAPPQSIPTTALAAIAPPQSIPTTALAAIAPPLRRSDGGGAAVRLRGAGRPARWSVPGRR
jgi:hypothetical protein